MANADSTQTRFTATPGVYLHNPTATASDRSEQLSARLGQLSAMLLLMHGDPGEAFARVDERYQDDYIWACWTLAEECRELAGRGLA